MDTTPLYLAIILAQANAYLRASVTLRLSGTVAWVKLDSNCETAV